MGLWPFNFWQSNKVSQDSANGLRLTPPGKKFGDIVYYLTISLVTNQSIAQSVKSSERRKEVGSSRFEVGGDQGVLSVE